LWWTHCITTTGSSQSPRLRFDLDTGLSWEYRLLVETG
jgi:hypothetical protein